MHITQQDAKRRNTTCSRSLCYTKQCMPNTNCRLQELAFYIIVFIHRLFHLFVTCLSTSLQRLMSPSAQRRDEPRE